MPVTLIGVISPRLDEATARAAELASTAKDATFQSDDIKLERAKLLAEIAARQGIVRQAKLINLRAQQSLDPISDPRRSISACGPGPKRQKAPDRMRPG